jgi:hypothetical protein
MLAFGGKAGFARVNDDTLCGVTRVSNCDGFSQPVIVRIDTVGTYQVG